MYEGIYAPAKYVTQSENPFRKGLKYYNLLSNKHVPDDYIYNSREVRLQLLAGLIDSDGELKHKGYFVNLKNKQIVEKCCTIARSLGFRANVFPNKKKSQTGYEGQYWKLSISGNTDLIPTKISYKRAFSRIIHKDPLVSGIKITEIGEGDYYGFEIDGNKRFLLGDFTVTHNTEVICGICKAITCPTVLLADQTVVVQQIKERLQLRDISEDIGIFYAGKRPNGQTIVVGSVASLLPPKPPKPVDLKDPDYDKKYKAYQTKLKAYKTRKKNAKDLQQYVKDAEMIIVDECDRASSNIYKYVFRHLFKGRRRYGFSGTPLDPDRPVEGFIMQSHLGSIIHKESRQHLTEIGRIIPCEYYSIAFGLDGSIKDKRAFDFAINDFMVNSERLHNLIMRLCKSLISPEEVVGKDRNGTVVLVEREALGDTLLRILGENNIKAEFIYGRTPKRRRSEVLHMFEQREIDVLIGGKIINRGLDLKGGCESLIIASGGKLQSEFIQKIGRALRHNKKGKSKIYDIFFRCNKYLYNHSKARLHTMINAGYKTHLVLPGGKVDGPEFVRSNYRIPRNLT